MAAIHTCNNNLHTPQQQTVHLKQMSVAIEFVEINWLY